MNKQVYLYFIAAIAAMGGLLFGFDTGVINVALPTLRLQFGLSPSDEGFVTSAVIIGGMIGPLISGLLSDRLGRKKINILAAVIFVVGSIVVAIAGTINAIIVGRLLLGLAVGIVSSSIPLYLAEIAPAKMRGQLVTFFQFAIVIGIVSSYVVGLFFAESAEGWRSMFWAGFVPAAVLFFGMLTVPESPRWLFTKGRVDEARQVLTKFYDDADIDLAISEMQQTSQTSPRSKDDWKDLFSKKYRTPLFIGIGIFLIQQFSGINAVIYYSTKIFEMAGFTSAKTSTLATVGVGVVNAASTIVAMFVLDRWGRKPLLYTGLLGTAAALGTIAFAFYAKDSLGPEALKVLSVGGVYVYIFFFAISLGPLGWLLIAEIYPLRIRGFASSMGGFYHWFFDFFVTYSFPILAATSLGTNGGIFMIYMSVVLIGLLFAKFVVPETKGLSLEQIENLWEKKK